MWYSLVSATFVHGCTCRYLHWWFRSFAVYMYTRKFTIIAVSRIFFLSVYFMLLKWPGTERQRSVAVFYVLTRIKINSRGIWRGSEVIQNNNADKIYRTKVRYKDQRTASDLIIVAYKYAMILSPTFQLLCGHLAIKIPCTKAAGNIDFVDQHLKETQGFFLLNEIIYCQIR